MSESTKLTLTAVHVAALKVLYDLFAGRFESHLSPQYPLPNEFEAMVELDDTNAYVYFERRGQEFALVCLTRERVIYVDTRSGASHLRTYWIPTSIDWCQLKVDQPRVGWTLHWQYRFPNVRPDSDGWKQVSIDQLEE